jgi:hypothetical protein
VPHRRPASKLSRWLVVLTFWLAAFAPAVSLALAAERGELPPWTQLCRSSLVGPRAQPAAATVQPDEQTGTHGLFAGCAWCGLHMQDLSLPPPATPTPALRLDLRVDPPATGLGTAMREAVWPSASARAPPQGL